MTSRIRTCSLMTLTGSNNGRCFSTAPARRLISAILITRIAARLKGWCAMLLATHSPRTAECYCYNLRQVSPDRIRALFVSKPQGIRSFWKVLHSSDIPDYTYSALKSLLAFLCTFSIGHWGPQWLDLVSQLPLPKVDKYATVRLGEA